MLVTARTHAWHKLHPKTVACHSGDATVDIIDDAGVRANSELFLNSRNGSFPVRFLADIDDLLVPFFNGFFCLKEAFVSFDRIEAQHFAEGVARDAGQLLLDWQGRVHPREKGPSDLVTEADFASQRLIADAITARYPDHSLLAEEEDVVADPAKSFHWVVDPLDGTINYAHKLPFWCVSIGLRLDGDPVLGVIYDPIADRMFSASKGAGATLNGEPIHVSATERLSASLISTGLPTSFSADAERQLALFRAFSDGTHSVRRTGSTALNLAFVAWGAFELFYATSVKAWDIAAGLVIVREAGGSVTRLDGSEFDFERPGILAGNGRVDREARARALEAWPTL